MRRIDLTPYAMEGGEYRVRYSLSELAFVPQDGCRGPELLKRAALAQKIETWPSETLLLEQAEWQRLVEAVNSGQVRLGRNDVELVRRILNAPDVPVQEAPPAG